MTNSETVTKRGRAASSKDADSVARRKRYKEWTEKQSKDIGKRIAHYRDLRRLSNQELLSKLHEAGLEIKLNTLNGIISGKRSNFSYPDVLIFAAALDISPIHLLFDARSSESVEILPNVLRAPTVAWIWFTDSVVPYYAMGSADRDSEQNDAVKDTKDNRGIVRTVENLFYWVNNCNFANILYTKELFTLEDMQKDPASEVALSDQEKLVQHRKTNLLNSIRSAQQEYLEILNQEIHGIDQYIPSYASPIFRDIRPGMRFSEMPDVAIPIFGDGENSNFTHLFHVPEVHRSDSNG